MAMIRHCPCSRLAMGQDQNRPAVSNVTSAAHAGVAVPAVLYRDTPDQLGRRQCYRSVPGDQPGEAALLQPLGEQTETLAVPVKNFQQSTSAGGQTDGLRTGPAS